MKELSLEEAALAWAQKKNVEATDSSGMGDFYSIAKPGSKNGRWNSLVFIGDGNHRFRIAIEPPAKKFRPYMRSEIEKHLGVGVQHKGRGYSAIIIAVFDEAVHIGMWNYTLDELLENFTWSDCSPCGVEVDA